jgi:hypothetical protein
MKVFTMLGLLKGHLTPLMTHTTEALSLGVGVGFWAGLRCYGLGLELYCFFRLNKKT